MMRYLLLVGLVICCLACHYGDEDPFEEECALDMEAYDFSFGIDYEHPEKYLMAGEQSGVDSALMAVIREELDREEQSTSGIKEVCEWFSSNFKFENAGGANIGLFHVNELIESKRFYGCHSAALVISSVLRELDYPAVMIETASVLWAEEYIQEINQGMAGHVMTEVYVGGRWILADNNGALVREYDCLNPYINTQSTDYYYNRKGLFVIAKGIDIWDYGVRSYEDTDVLMFDFVDHFTCFREYFGSLRYEWR